jgi:hypothetical protein
MPGHTCCDPLEVTCGWDRSPFFRLVFVEEELPESNWAGPCLLSLPQWFAVPELPPHVALELRCTDPFAWTPQSCGRRWSLFLEYTIPFQNDDLALAEQVLERAAAAGCCAVVAGGLPGASQYRYRWMSLLRLLCDRFKLKFSICEPAELPPSERLNGYLASQRGCCRHPFFDPRRPERAQLA